MSIRTAMAAALLAVLCVPGAAMSQPEMGQGCGEQCLDVVDAMFAWFPEHFDVPLSSVLVDTVRSGRELTIRPDKARPVNAADLAVARSKHGFGVRGDTRVQCEGRQCTIEGGSIIMSFNAPDISGVWATMRVAVTRETTIKPGRGINPAEVGESRVSSKLYRVTLRRLGATWFVTSAEVIALS